MNATWLIAVGAGRWQIPGIRAAQNAGLRVFAIDAQADAPGFAHAERHATVDILDVPAVTHAIREAAIRPAGAIAFCNEAGMPTAAALRQIFGLPGHGPAVVEAMIRKDRQRALWTRAGAPCPRWGIAHNASEAERVFLDLAITCILKPVDSAGSRGVTVVPAGGDWRSAYEHARSFSRSGLVIIEEFIVGIEHTVETFSHAGRTTVLAITAKRKVPGTGDTVASELASATLPEAELNRMGETVRQALAALGYLNGPGHTEVLRTADGQLYLVESAGRGGGFMVADGIVPQVSGFDLATACARQAVGLDPGWPETLARRAVVLRFLPSRRGRVTHIAGFDQDQRVPGVLTEPLVQLGQDVGQAVSDGDRMAYILATADTTAAALALADAQEARLQILVA